MSEAKLWTSVEVSAVKAMTQYVLDHEEDIASCSNDFEELHGVFVALIGREPEWERPKPWLKSHA